MNIFLLMVTFVITFQAKALAESSPEMHSNNEVEEYIVFAPKVKGSTSALLEDRRNSKTVNEVLGSEQMSRQGDSDAASSLRRITGLTLMGGKYIYIRGLGERYSGVQMNSLSLASPEPSKRVIPLDLFPATILESVTVQKSFSPDLPAEFGGGLILLQTKTIPDRFSAKVSLSTISTSYGEKLTYNGGSKDFLAKDDGTRAMPSQILSTLQSGKKLNENFEGFEGGVSAQELEALGQSLSTSYSPYYKNNNPPPNFNLSLGDKWQFESIKIGALGSLLYSSEIDDVLKSSQKWNIASGSELTLDEKATTTSFEQNYRLGVTLDFGLELKATNTFRYSLIQIQDASDKVEIKKFTQIGDSVLARQRTNLEWVERGLSFHLLSGKHKINTSEASDFNINWRIGRTLASRQSPDSREYTYLLKDSMYELNTDTTGNRRVFSQMSDHGEEIAIDLDQSWQTASLGKAKIKLGFNNYQKNRHSDVYRLHLKNQFTSGSLPDLTKTPEEIFAKDNVGTNKFVLTNLTESADSYSAQQLIQGQYLNFEWQPSDVIVFSTGARLESSNQNVQTYYYFDPLNPTSEAGLEMKDLTPVHSLTWKTNEQWIQRFSYSETLARPDFRELSTVPFIDDESGYEVVGNSQLQGTVIKNIDFRTEYYFSTDELASFSLFTKEFFMPIEQIFEPSPNLRKTFANTQSANNQGVELELRLGLRRWSRDLRRWTLVSNVSLIDSTVNINKSLQGVLTSSERPLQGQSPYIINLQLQYDRPVYGLSGTLLYNVIGPRITEVGTNNRPDIYEQPLHEIDFVGGWRWNKNENIGLKIKNLADASVVAMQADKVVRSYKKGQSISVSYAYSL